VDYYLDIQLRPTPESSQPLLMSVLYGKLHRALVTRGAGKLGVSFPDHSAYSRTLGMVIRLHADAGTLDSLMSSLWLGCMAGRIITGEILSVPSGVSYRVVRRVQGKTNVERLRRRYARRHGVALEEARRIIPAAAESRIKLPFVMLCSQSTGQKFPLFVEHLPERASPTEGEFSAYGLSATATIPWF
jgi:CRISPR-associated endonuclease Csy4